MSLSPPETRNPQADGPPDRISSLKVCYLFVLGLFVEREIEVEDGVLKKFS